MNNVSKNIDKVVLHRFWGIPIFVLIMYGLFFSVVNCSYFLEKPLIESFQKVYNILIFKVLYSYLISIPNWLLILLYGLNKGIIVILSLIPLLLVMFFLLTLLEQSNYLSRVEIIMGDFMGLFRLPSKALIPMIMGFGCNVSAIVSSRMVTNYREKVLSIIIIPFMSCSSRLVVYAVFATAFFSTMQQNVILGLYLVGIIAAIFTGIVVGSILDFHGYEGSCVNKTKKKNEMKTVLVNSLSAYKFPNIKTILFSTIIQVKDFTKKISKIIILLCVFISFINSANMITSKSISNINNIDSMDTVVNGNSNYLQMLGSKLSPFFAPMGIEADNWPAIVGLISGIVSKEILLGTLSSLYVLKQEPLNFLQQQHEGGHLQESDVFTSTETSDIISTLTSNFNSTISAFSYLLFVLLYFPCMSVIASISYELNKYWAMFVIVWTSSLAYFVAVLFYQFATFFEHPWVTLGWLVVSIGWFGVICLFLFLVCNKLTDVGKDLRYNKFVCNKLKCNKSSL